MLVATPWTALSPASYGVACNTCKNSPTRSLQVVCITSQANLTRYFHTQRPSFESTPQQSAWFLHPRTGRRRLNAPIKWPLSSRQHHARPWNNLQLNDAGLAALQEDFGWLTLTINSIFLGFYWPWPALQPTRRASILKRHFPAACNGASHLNEMTPERRQNAPWMALEARLEWRLKLALNGAWTASLECPKMALEWRCWCAWKWHLKQRCWCAWKWRLNSAAGAPENGALTTPLESLKMAPKRRRWCA